jgi:tetratricopeptide (TPR) repeat protein
VRVAACQPTGLLRTRTYLDLVGLAEPAAAERLLAGVSTERARPSGRVRFPGPTSAAPREQARRFPARRPAIFRVPPRNPHFTGRSDLLARLRRDLAETSTGAVVQASAVHGLGGVGKTQLAIEYAHRYASDYDLVWWLPAEEPVAIGGRLAALARRLGIAEATDQAETIAALWDELGQRDRWLLVYDNATDPAELDLLRPPVGGGHLLVTSRDPAWGGIATTVRLDVLSRAEAVGFLRQRLGHDDPALGPLAEALGDLPLALEQAAAYLEQTHTPPGTYLELLATRARELFALGRPATSERTIATTWNVSLQRLHTEAPAAEDLLRLCAFLAPDDVPRTLLEGHPDLLPEPLATAIHSRVAFHQAVGALRRYSLVTTTSDTLRMHRLVQAVTRHDLAPEEQKHWAVAGVRLVLAGFPERAGDDADTWPMSARLLPHALTTTSHPPAQATDPQTTVSLLNRVGDYLWGRADYHDARQLLEQAVSVAEHRLGPDDPTTAHSYHNLAHVLADQGDLDTARRLHERALAIYEARLGPDHPTTAHSLHNLAQVLRDQGDLAYARTLYERAVAIFEARLGADHPDTAGSLNQLGELLHQQGDLIAARSMHERALAIWEAHLGGNHPTIAYCLNALAQVLHDQGDLQGARTLHERALAIDEARLGADHPYTAYCLDNLATVLHDQGDLQGARSLHERALSIREARLGGDHPYTATSLHNLALVLVAQGDLQGARPLHERALAIREARLGADHPETVRSRRNLAAVVAALDEQR